MAEPDPHILLFAGPFQLRGTCSYTLRLMQYLQENGFSVTVNCNNADLIHHQSPTGIPIREYRRLGMPLLGRAIRHIMLREAETSPPDLIHIQSRSVLEDGQWLARHLQRPYVITVHDHLGPHETFHPDPLWCQKVIAVSDSIQANLLAQTSLTKEMTTVIHTGVEVPSLDEIAAPLKSGHVPVVGTAGPLEAVKGFPYFLSAAQQVLASGRDVEFLIAGAGPEEFNLRRLTRELGIVKQVTFVPNLANLTESLAAMDIFCLPSLQQGLGTIMLEPMAMAKPVIASDVGGVYSVIDDNRTGLMVPPSDSHSLAERILELLNDPERARAIGQSGRSRVLTEFRVDKMIGLTAKLYRRVLENPEPVAVTAAATN